MQRLRKFLVAVFLTALTAGLVWAGAELLGQANKSAADAGSNAADLEMASIEFSKPPAEAVNVNWGEINRLRKQMQTNTDQYKRLVSGLNGEKASASVQAQGMKLANAFRDLCEKEAKLWDAAGNCPTRARLARETGLSRVASAEMALSGADADKIDAYNEQMSKMQDARSGYTADAKKDLSLADRQSLQSSLLPKAQSLLTSVTTLSSQVTGLLKEVTSQAGSIASGDPMAIAGCARQAISGASSDNPAMALLSPVKALSSMVMSMLSSVKGLISDIMSLA